MLGDISFVSWYFCGQQLGRIRDNEILHRRDRLRQVNRFFDVGSFRQLHRRFGGFGLRARVGNHLRFRQVSRFDRRNSILDRDMLRFEARFFLGRRLLRGDDGFHGHGRQLPGLLLFSDGVETDDLTPDTLAQKSLGLALDVSDGQTSGIGFELGAFGNALLV